MSIRTLCIIISSLVGHVKRKVKHFSDKKTRTPNHRLSLFRTWSIQSSLSSDNLRVFQTFFELSIYHLDERYLCCAALATNQIEFLHRFCDPKGLIFLSICFVEWREYQYVNTKDWYGFGISADASRAVRKMGCCELQQKSLNNSFQ